MTQDELKAAVLADRRASYIRLRGGFPVPLAGAVYWLAVAGLSFYFPPAKQLNYAFIASGMIFPLAIGLAALFRNDFMKDKTATGTVMVPTFIAMLLFWPMLVTALAGGADAGAILVILAIGMSLHWPVIGWSYGRPAIFTAHALIRAAAVMALYFLRPEQVFMEIPLAVAAVYLVSVIAIYVDSGLVARQEASAGAGG